jgi:sulfur carrier protein ThiS
MASLHGDAFSRKITRSAMPTGRVPPRRGAVQITVEIHGRVPTALKIESNRIVLELADGSTVGAALQALGLSERDPWNAAVRGKLVRPQDVLHDGDRLLIFEPIGGG